MKTIVKFQKGRGNSLLTRHFGKIGFPERGRLQPKEGELWVVDIAGENPKGTVYFLRLFKKFNPQSSTDWLACGHRPQEDWERGILVFRDYHGPAPDTEIPMENSPEYAQAYQDYCFLRENQDTLILRGDRGIGWMREGESPHASSREWWEQISLDERELIPVGDRVEEFLAARKKNLEKYKEEEQQYENAMKKLRSQFPFPTDKRERKFFHRIIPYKRIEVEECWEGDGMRPGSNIRSATISYPFFTPEDYAFLVEECVSYLEGEERITGMDRGGYACNILEAAEDGHIEARLIADAVNHQHKCCFQKVEFEEVKEGEFTKQWKYPSLPELYKQVGEPLAIKDYVEKEVIKIWQKKL